MYLAVVTDVCCSIEDTRTFLLLVARGNAWEVQ